MAGKKQAGKTSVNSKTGKPNQGQTPNAKNAQGTKAKDQNSVDDLYVKAKPWAEWIKTFLQMTIGGLLVALLATKFFFHFFDFHLSSVKWLDYLWFIHSLPTLLIVSKALEYSAGIELAYMLFTPGPDEAIAPLVTSAAAGLMHAIAYEGQLDIQSVFAMLLYVIVIAALFVVKEIFSNGEGDDEKGFIYYLRKKYQTTK